MLKIAVVVVLNYSAQQQIALQAPFLLMSIAASEAGFVFLF